MIDLWAHIRLYIPFGSKNGCDTKSQAPLSKIYTKWLYMLTSDHGRKGIAKYVGAYTKKSVIKRCTWVPKDYVTNIKKDPDLLGY
jgi:hypothetical protein